MRVYSLVFLTSSALSSRVDGVLEPASSNVTALDFPAVVRPLPDNDDDATASRSSTRDGPPDADERGPLVEPFSSAFSKIVGLGRRATLKGEQKEPQRSRLLMRDRVFVKYVDAALKDKEFGDLYRLYEASGQSMIDDLANHYGADVVARAVAAARKTNTDNPARFQEPSTTVEKLVKDLLQRWLKEKKELKDVFTALKINHYEFTAGELADILYNRQVDVSIVEFARKMTSPKLTLLEDYSKLKMADKSDVAYLRAIMDGFGGEKQLFLLLREANGKNFLIDKADELEDAFLKMCAFDGMSPSDAFKRLGTGQKAEEFFRTKRLDKMTKYVEDYNKKKSTAQPTTVLNVLRGRLLKMFEKGSTNDEMKANMMKYERELFKHWYSKKVTPTERLQERIQHLDAAAQVVIKLRYKDFYNRRRTPPE